MTSDHKFRHVSCGWDSTAGITTGGRLFVWGSNSQEQLGFSRSTHKMILEPMELRLPFNGKAADIQFGLRHSAILTTDNRLYIIGSLKYFKHSKHQLMNYNSTEYLHVVADNSIRQIASGQNHIVFLDNQNVIHGIGDNRFMQSIRCKPEAKVIRLLSGWTHNGFLTDARELCLYGRNNYGQLGNGSRVDCAEPQMCQIHPIDEAQLGAEHGILKSNDGVYTWGWNEHGNCGNGTVDDV